MDTITLTYTPFGGTLTSKGFNVNAVRGLDDPDEFAFFPALQHNYLDGTIEDQIKGFRRIITIDFGVIADRNDRIAILNFILDNGRKLSYGSPAKEVFVMLDDPSGFSNNWLDSSALGRHFVLKLKEKTINQEFTG